MIKRGFEITIFILIFFITGILLMPFFLQMKAKLPLNAGMTTEEVIISTYPELKDKDLYYNYKIENGYLLLYRETLDGNCKFEIGYKNDNSGYIIELPGVFLRGDISKIKTYITELENGFAVSININKYFDSYILEFVRIGREDAEFYCNSNIIEPFMCEATGESKYILVIEDISQNYRFTCQSNGKTYDLVDMQTILDLY